MLTRLRQQLSYANVTATLALFIALGGTSYAALTLPRNSVGSKQIRSRSVGSSELHTSAVTSRTVRNRSLALRDLSRSARQSLQGERGPIGPPGPAGVTYRAAIPSGGSVAGGNAIAAAHVGGTNEYRVAFAVDVACLHGHSNARRRKGRDKRRAARRRTNHGWFRWRAGAGQDLCSGRLARRAAVQRDRGLLRGAPAIFADCSVHRNQHSPDGRARPRSTLWTPSPLGSVASKRRSASHCHGCALARRACLRILTWLAGNLVPDTTRLLMGVGPLRPLQQLRENVPGHPRTFGPPYPLPSSTAFVSPPDPEHPLRRASGRSQSVPPIS